MPNRRGTLQTEAGSGTVLRSESRGCGMPSRSGRYKTKLKTLKHDPQTKTSLKHKVLEDSSVFFLPGRDGDTASAASSWMSRLNLLPENPG